MNWHDRISQEKVIDYWKQDEGYKGGEFRGDIIGKFPTDLVWHDCSLETSDIANIFINSSDDWIDLTEKTFLVTRAAHRVDEASSHKDTARHSRKILGQQRDIEKGTIKPITLILICCDQSGPWTLVDGNHRAVALQRLDKLDRARAFVGLSPDVRNYFWARYTYC